MKHMKMIPMHIAAHFPSEQRNYFEINIKALFSMIGRMDYGFIVDAMRHTTSEEKKEKMKNHRALPIISSKLPLAIKPAHQFHDFI